MSENLSRWSQEINENLGTRFAVGEDGRLQLSFENGVTAGVEIDAGGGHYTIYAPLFVLNAARDLSLLVTALKMNLYQVETAGGVIGLDADYGTLVYSFRFPVSQSGAEILARQLNEFASLVEHLKQALQTSRDDEAESIDWRKTDLAELVDDPDGAQNSEEGLVPAEEHPIDPLADHSNFIRA